MSEHCSYVYVKAGKTALVQCRCGNEYEVDGGSVGTYVSIIGCSDSKCYPNPPEDKLREISAYLEKRYPEIQSSSPVVAACRVCGTEAAVAASGVVVNSYQCASCNPKDFSTIRVEGPGAKVGDPDFPVDLYAIQLDRCTYHNFEDAVVIEGKVSEIPTDPVVVVERGARGRENFHDGTTCLGVAFGRGDMTAAEIDLAEKTLAEAVKDSGYKKVGQVLIPGFDANGNRIET